MKKNLTSRQKINSELAARAINKKSSEILKEHIPHEERENVKIEFICECADPDCKTKIALTLQEYEGLHSNFARFMVAKDHVEPNLEKVKKSGKNISVVEKYALS